MRLIIIDNTEELVENFCSMNLIPLYEVADIMGITYDELRKSISTHVHLTSSANITDNTFMAAMDAEYDKYLNDLKNDCDLNGLESQSVEC